MKKIVFVWTSPHLFGVPWEQLILKKYVVSYCDLLKQYFEINQMNYSIEIDTTFGKLDELSERKYDIWVFLEGNKKRYLTYRDELIKRKNSIYYLSISELYGGEISQFLLWLSQRYTR